jgi:pSer/pThr/pTyr-binding forkhead associated (FHA) protein
MDAPAISTAPRLVTLDGKSQIAIPLQGTSIVVGSSADAGAYIGFNKAVSRKHCRIDDNDGAFAITDLGSSNGTRLNGMRLQPQTTYELHDGDMVSLANSHFSFEIGGTKSNEAPSAPGPAQATAPSAAPVMPNGERAVVVLKVEDRGIDVDLDIPLDITPAELLVALDNAYHLGLDTSDQANLHVCIENPIALLKGPRALWEYGVHNGTIIYL